MNVFVFLPRRTRGLFRFVPFVLVILFGLLLPSAVCSPAQAQARKPLTGRQIYEKFRYSVFASQKDKGNCTGFRYYTTIITCFQSLKDAKKVSLNLGSERIQFTHARAFSEQDNFIVLNAPKFFGRGVEVDGSSTLKTGDKVYVVDQTLGAELAIADGVLSRRRSVNGKTYLQISIPIEAAGSGSPLINEHGQVVGMVVGPLETGQQLNFAIPIETIVEHEGTPLSMILQARGLPLLPRRPLLPENETESSDFPPEGYVALPRQQEATPVAAPVLREASGVAAKGSGVRSSVGGGGLRGVGSGNGGVGEAVGGNGSGRGGRLSSPTNLGDDGLGIGTVGARGGGMRSMDGGGSARGSGEIREGETRDANPKSTPGINIPDFLRGGNFRGRVSARLNVSTSGSVLSVTITSSSGNGDIDALARSAFQRWRFDPAKRNGISVPSTFSGTINIRVD